MPNGANFVDLHVYVGGAGTLDHRARSTTTSTPTRRPTSRCRSPIRRSRPSCSIRCTCCRSGSSRSPGSSASSPRSTAWCGSANGCWASRRANGWRVAMLWTAVGIWIEPLRSTFDYGQINVLLVLAVLYAVYSTRWWLSGLLVGLAAGVKLTPAVGGLYFVGARRWGAAVFSAVVFLATVGGVRAGRRRPNPLLLHRTARRRRPRRPDRDVVQPVVARRHLADPRPRRRLRPARGGGDRRHRRAGGAGLARDRRRRGPARRASSSCSCSGCWCRRSRGRITGCG